MNGATGDRKSRFSDQDYRDILAFRDQLRRFLAWSEIQCRAAGLTPSQHQLLLAVRGHPAPEPPTIGEIAEHLQLRHHSAVGLIDRAETAGLIRRVHTSRDRRVVRILLEPAGEDALEKLTALHVTELAVLAEASAALRAPAQRAPAATEGSGEVSGAREGI
ncbi:MAG: MarR family transcriptional regulator [Actinomycetota bacterium]|nr:MarR family transcriptional regulator [Actinomycetota bacterium]